MHVILSIPPRAMRERVRSLWDLCTGEPLCTLEERLAAGQVTGTKRSAEQSAEPSLGLIDGYMHDPAAPPPPPHLLIRTQEGSEGQVVEVISGVAPHRVLGRVYGLLPNKFESHLMHVSGTTKTLAVVTARSMVLVYALDVQDS